MLIYAKHITERLIYTLDFIFKERDLNYQITSDFDALNQSKGPKLNYSHQKTENTAQIIPSSILFNSGIENYTIDASVFFNEKCLVINGVVDPIASVFYILTRYEEYNSSQKDKFGRHLGKKSVLYRFGWHHMAMCDRWSIDVLEFLKLNSTFSFNKKKYKPQIIPTFDIDKAYAFKHKGLLRNLLGYFKDLLTGNKKLTKERRMVIAGSKKDPFDNYDKIYEIHYRGFDVKLFWMLGNYGKFDKNISYKNRRHQRLIRKMNEVVTIGIHPSYKSNFNEFHIHNEIERLQSIIKKNVKNSRQHYLMLSFPITYDRLSEQGIEEDYSMGYADITGFRAGTARKFHWFNLSVNKKTKLLIHPFLYMDGTLNEYLKLNTNEAEEHIAKLYLETQSYGGQFIFLWHNDTIGDYGHWSGWSRVLEFSLRLDELNV
ncbi:MAG: polysaccharide deacetylase family protein [Crocinitomicaceae bacterium]|nr:polysaccharide deacetylase family protein [Crocinitomicaceae bacterium]MDG2506597.1 polysaccharide deacetylase family protein [Crocinitomicaceae bacterium]